MSTAGVPSWVGDLGHLDGLSDAALVTDREGLVIFANTAARRLHQLPGEDEPRVRLATVLLPEAEADLFVEISRSVLAGGQWRGRLDVREIDGSVRPADVTCTPLRRQEVIEGLVCIVDDAASRRGQGRRTRRLEDRLTRLARVAAALGSAEDVETVTQVVVAQAADAVGATVASLSVVVDDDTLALVGLRGGLKGAARRWATFSMHDQVPASDAVRSGQLLIIAGADEIAARYPNLESAADGERTIVCLPLNVLGATLGVVTLSFPGQRELDAAELEFFGILADSCAQALERIRARDEAISQTSRLRFLATATGELSRSLEYQKTLAVVAHLAVPQMADWCAIDMVEDDRLHRLAVEHVDPAKVQLAIDLHHRYPPRRDVAGGPWEVIETGRSSLLDVSDELLSAAAVDEEHLQLLRDLQLRSVALVPLVVRGQVLGVITWVAAESRRRFTQADLAFLEDLAKRCAIAIDNSQLYSQTMEIAVRLQDAVLPDLTAIVPGWSLANYYSPSGRTEVGGDFFDAVELPDGRLAMFVGDVMGRGVQAAAAMAQMRASIRAFIAVDPEPEAVLHKLDLLFTTYGMTQLVTLVYLVADPARDEVRLVNAGHPPPVLLHPDGTVEQLPLADGAPVGISTEARKAMRIDFRGGDTVIAFTDGLIERRDEDIDVGQKRLLDNAALLGERDPAQALPELVDRVRDHTREDDVAVLVARRAGR